MVDMMVVIVVALLDVKKVALTVENLVVMMVENLDDC